mgnify:CR=1 FL=1
MNLLNLENGIKIIKEARKTTAHSPGVYRMINSNEDVLYVGKAKSLTKRLGSYTNTKSLPYRLCRMVASTVKVEVIITESEVEALLLESSLIKTLKPKYNIVLRDDKSFPYILITSNHKYPRIMKFRGSRSKNGKYFGPFASASAVSQTLNTLHRAFPLRSCSDSIFKNRNRPCLEYQIKRCSAPCVGRISSEDYEKLVKEAADFLRGSSQEAQKRLSRQMTQASENLEFETAASYRDRIRALAHIQAQQIENLYKLGNVDVIAINQLAGQSCVQVFFYRGGHSYGNRSYFPRHSEDSSMAEVLYAFISQFYSDKNAPNTILINVNLPESELIVEALSSKSNFKVQIQKPIRGNKRKLIDDVSRNASEALSRKLAESASHRSLVNQLGKTLQMSKTPERIEVYDNSHISGDNAVGCVIVVGSSGFEKKAYRKYNIKGNRSELNNNKKILGDDYSMLKEVLNRRFSKLKSEKNSVNYTGVWPDLCLIDGGPGHLSVAESTLKTLNISKVKVAAVAKGRDRNAGKETIYISDQEPIALPQKDPVLYFVQRIRDEAHRFAINTHRSRRNRSTLKSALDEIPGIGAARKRALLNHFGSTRVISSVGVKDLEQVEGVSKKIALLIYGYFHDKY